MDAPERRRLSTEDDEPLSELRLRRSDLDDYERGALWKHLRRACGLTLWEGEVGGHAVRVRVLEARSP